MNTIQRKMDLENEIEKYLLYCEYQKQLDWKTIRAYRNDIQQFVKYISKYGEKVGKSEINDYIVYIHKKYKQKTVKRKIASVKSLYRYLEDEEIIKYNPFQRIKTKFKEEMVLPKIIPRSIIQQLLAFLYKKQKSDKYSEWKKKVILRDITIIELLFATGMRISELCHMKKDCIDLKRGVICILGKGKKERYLQITNEEVLKILCDYYLQHKDDISKHGNFFVNRYGMPLSEQAVRIMLHKYAKEIQISLNITPHMFRHSFATFLMEEDVNIRYIQKMLGHASIMTTQIYTYVSTEKEKQILKDKHPRNKMNIQKTEKTQIDR